LTVNSNTAKGVTACQTAFNLQMGLDQQQQDLTRWKATLSTECFSALMAETARRNGLLRTCHSGHDVFHSLPMIQWINEWRPAS
jgi:hypothetical protein